MTAGASDTRGEGGHDHRYLGRELCACPRGIEAAAKTLRWDHRRSYRIDVAVRGKVRFQDHRVPNDGQRRVQGGALMVPTGGHGPQAKVKEGGRSCLSRGERGESGTPIAADRRGDECSTQEAFPAGARPSRAPAGSLRASASPGGSGAQTVTPRPSREPPFDVWRRDADSRRLALWRPASRVGRQGRGRGSPLAVWGAGRRRLDDRIRALSD